MCLSAKKMGDMMQCNVTWHPGIVGVWMNLEMKSMEVARTEDLVVVRYSQNAISNDRNCRKR